MERRLSLVVGAHDIDLVLDQNLGTIDISILSCSKIILFPNLASLPVQWGRSIVRTLVIDGHPNSEQVLDIINFVLRNSVMES
jgi:hypothetical protein